MTKFMAAANFFKAEDGIRDLTVTGVQTCALPIFAVVAGLVAVVFHYGGPGGTVRRGYDSFQTKPSPGATKDRKSGVEGKGGELGGRPIIKKKKFKPRRCHMYNRH